MARDCRPPCRLVKASGRQSVDPGGTTDGRDAWIRLVLVPFREPVDYRGFGSVGGTQTDRLPLFLSLLFSRDSPPD
jgi:hypothetical protein